MKRMLVLLGLLVVCSLAVFAAGSVMDPPNSVMNWIVTAAATVVAVPLVNWLKGALLKWVGAAMSAKVNQFVSWGVCYILAIIGYAIGGLLTGVDVWSTLLASGWSIFAAGSAVSILANLVYNVISSGGTTTA